MKNRRLSLFDATMMVMGGIIGVGIFFTPARVAAQVGSAEEFLALWALGGLVALCGAFTFAELAGSIPREGGWYAFLREGCGRFPAFLFAWVILFVTSTGAIAVMMDFLTQTLAQLFPALGASGSLARTALGAGVIMGITTLALFGVRIGALFQNACMLAKLAALSVLGLAALAVGFSGEALAAPPAAEQLPHSLPAALLAVLFSCGGWQMVCYIGPAVENPERNLPRAIVLGVVGITSVYLATNFAFLSAFGLEGLAGNSGFAGQIATHMLGAAGSKLLLAAMVVSALGITVVNILATPWMYVAMAKEGLFFRRFGELSPHTGAPTLALLLQAGICLAYWFAGQAHALVDAVVFIEWFFHGLVAFALLRLRRTRPDLPRPFASPLYPLAPLIYLAVALGVIGGNLQEANPGTIGMGLGVLALGMLVYRPWQSLMRRRSA